MDFVCSQCGHREDSSSYKAMCSCSGLWELDYRPENLDLSKINKSIWSIFRYKDYMGFMGDEWKNISLGEGISPVIRYDDQTLLKIDYLMPTLSYKDRGAAALISHCKAIGVKKIIQDSSGNAGNSIAAYAARAGIECEIYVPKSTSQKKIDMIEAHGANCVIVSGNRDMTAKLARQKVHDEQIYYASHVYNPIFYQGTKTFIYEIYENLQRLPDCLVLPIGNGTLFIGAMIALEEFLYYGIIEKVPKILAVQTEKCCPIYKAYINKEKDIKAVTCQDTLAEGIAIGEPARGKEILDYIYKYDIEIILAKEDKIYEAKDELARSGLYVENTSAAIYAAYKEYIKESRYLGLSLISLTGAGLKSD